MGRRLVIFMVGFAAIVQTTIQCILDFVDGRNLAALLWLIGTFMLCFATVTGERIKQFLGE